MQDLRLMRIVFIAILITQTRTFAFGQIPCPRNQPVIAYHEELEVIFLFGGFCSESKTRLKDLWKFENGAWKEISSNQAPQARSGHALVYDSSNDRLILFGGKNNDGELLSDLWSWEGTDWQLLSEQGPPARQSHRIVTTKSGIILFGGSNGDGKSLSDTWIFSENSWVENNTGTKPPGRRQHTLTFDEKRKKVVLFGGFDRVEGEKIVFGDTWEFDGADWSLTDTNLDIARDHHAMVYNPHTNSTVLFGGYNDGYLGDTWSWNGRKWKKLAASGPARAGKPGLVFDSNLKRIVLFGGGNNDNMHPMDFWWFDDKTASWKEYERIN